MMYTCEYCKFNTNHNGKFERHLTTKKHILLMNQPNCYTCELCNFKNSKNNKFDYTCHLLTKKHIKNAGIKNNNKTGNPSGSQNVSIDPDTTQPMEYTNENMKKIIEQNEIIIKNQTDILNKIAETPPQIINNTTTFNLKVFLNETCKDAITIEEFMTNLVITDDLTNEFIEMGYVNGITNIIKRNLIKYAVSKRPMHCSDIKRQTIYLKCNDGWVYDEDMKNTLSVISKTKMRNFKKIHNENNVSKITDLDSSEYIMKSRIIREAMGGTSGSSISYLEKQDEKIIKNILNIVSINKTPNI